MKTLQDYSFPQFVARYLISSIHDSNSADSSLADVSERLVEQEPASVVYKNPGIFGETRPQEAFSRDRRPNIQFFREFSLLRITFFHARLLNFSTNCLEITQTKSLSSIRKYQEQRRMLPGSIVKHNSVEKVDQHAAQFLHFSSYRSLTVMYLGPSTSSLTWCDIFSTFLYSRSCPQPSR